MRVSGIISAVLLLLSFTNCASQQLNRAKVTNNVFARANNALRAPPAFQRSVFDRAQQQQTPSSPSSWRSAGGVYFGDISQVGDFQQQQQNQFGRGPAVTPLLKPDFYSVKQNSRDFPVSSQQQQFATQTDSVDSSLRPGTFYSSSNGALSQLAPYPRDVSAPRPLPVDRIPQYSLGQSHGRFDQRSPLTPVVSAASSAFQSLNQNSQINGGPGQFRPNPLDSAGLTDFQPVFPSPAGVEVHIGANAQNRASTERPSGRSITNDNAVFDHNRYQGNRITKNSHVNEHIQTSFSSERQSFDDTLDNFSSINQRQFIPDQHNVGTSRPASLHWSPSLRPLRETTTTTNKPRAAFTLFRVISPTSKPSFSSINDDRLDFDNRKVVSQPITSVQKNLYAVNQFINTDRQNGRFIASSEPIDSFRESKDQENSRASIEPYLPDSDDSPVLNNTDSFVTPVADVTEGSDTNFYQPTTERSFQTATIKPSLQNLFSNERAGRPLKCVSCSEDSSSEHIGNERSTEKATTATSNVSRGSDSHEKSEENHDSTPEASVDSTTIIKLTGYESTDSFTTDTQEKTTKSPRIESTSGVNPSTDQLATFKSPLNVTHSSEEETSSITTKPRPESFTIESIEETKSTDKTERRNISVNFSLTTTTKPSLTKLHSTRNTKRPRSGLALLLQKQLQARQQHQQEQQQKSTTITNNEAQTDTVISEPSVGTNLSSTTSSTAVSREQNASLNEQVVDNSRQSKHWALFGAGSIGENAKHDSSVPGNISTTIAKNVPKIGTDNKETKNNKETTTKRVGLFSLFQHLRNRTLSAVASTHNERHDLRQGKSILTGFKRPFLSKSHGNQLLVVNQNNSKPNISTSIEYSVDAQETTTTTTTTTESTTTARLSENSSTQSSNGLSSNSWALSSLFKTTPASSHNGLASLLTSYPNGFQIESVRRSSSVEAEQHLIPVGATTSATTRQEEIRLATHTETIDSTSAKSTSEGEDNVSVAISGSLSHDTSIKPLEIITNSTVRSVGKLHSTLSDVTTRISATESAIHRISQTEFQPVEITDNHLEETEAEMPTTTTTQSTSISSTQEFQDRQSEHFKSSTSFSVAESTRLQSSTSTPHHKPQPTSADISVSEDLMPSSSEDPAFRLDEDYYYENDELDEESQEGMLCVDSCQLQGRIRIIRGLSWSEDLNNRGSSDWNAASREVTEQLTRAFSLSPLAVWFDRVEVNSFREGSVIVLFTVTLANLAGRLRTADIVELFHSQTTELYSQQHHQYQHQFADNQLFDTDISSSPSGLRQLGNLLIDPEYTSFQVDTSDGVSRSELLLDEEYPIPEWLIAVIVVGLTALLFVVIFGVVVMWSRHKRRGVVSRACVPLTADMIGRVSKRHHIPSRSRSRRLHPSCMSPTLESVINNINQDSRKVVEDFDVYDQDEAWDDDKVTWMRAHHLAAQQTAREVRGDDNTSVEEEEDGQTEEMEGRTSDVYDSWDSKHCSQSRRLPADFWQNPATTATAQETRTTREVAGGGRREEAGGRRHPRPTYPSYDDYCDDDDDF